MNAVTVKSQVTIPKAVRDALGIEAGSQVEFLLNDAGEIILRRAGAEVPHSRFDRFVRGGRPRDDNRRGVGIDAR